MEKRKKILNRLNKLAALLVCLCLVVGVTIRAGRAYMPLRKEYGANWNMFLQEEAHSVDVLFLGLTHMYCAVIPAVFNQETGWTSYILAGPQQTPAVTYYYLKEALKTQSPSLVCLEVTGMVFGNNNYDITNIGYMPYSGNRLLAALRGAAPEDWLSLLFPLYAYHSRWEETGLSSIAVPRADEVVDPLAGFTYRDTATEEDTALRPRDTDVTQEIFDYNLIYLQKIIDLCREEHIDLQLFVAPTCQYIPDQWMDRLLASIGDNDLMDYSKDPDSLGMERPAHFFDPRHLNVYGARHFTGILAEDLTRRYTGSAHPHDEALWQERIAYLSQRMGED